MNRNNRSQIDRDYNGQYESEEELFAALEYPVGDLFDDDNFWQDEESEDAE